MEYLLTHSGHHIPWIKGKITGQTPPLKRNEIRAIRARLHIRGRLRDLAMSNMAIDSKLRACDLVRLRVHDVTQSGQAAKRAIVMQRKTRRPAQFELTDQSRLAVERWVADRKLDVHDLLFHSRKDSTRHISTRQYAKLLKNWVADIGLAPKCYGTHSLRRTRATLIDRRTKNLRAVQLLLGHAKVESTVCYLGVELDDALEIAEQTEI
jgi:integrase